MSSLEGVSEGVDDDELYTDDGPELSCAITRLVCSDPRNDVVADLRLAKGPYTDRRSISYKFLKPVLRPLCAFHPSNPSFKGVNRWKGL